MCPFVKCPRTAAEIACSSAYSTCTAVADTRQHLLSKVAKAKTDCDVCQGTSTGASFVKWKMLHKIDTNQRSIGTGLDPNQEQCRQAVQQPEKQVLLALSGPQLQLQLVCSRQPAELPVQNKLTGSQLSTQHSTDELCITHCL